MASSAAADSGAGASGAGASGAGASGVGVGGVGGESQQAGAGGGAPFSCSGGPGSCAPDELLERDFGACSGGGKCVPRPKACPDVDEPACACDGTLYPSACKANMAGVDVVDSSTCPPPVGTFYCGSALFCAHGTQYCQLINGSPSCEPLPADCMTPDADASCLVPVLCFAAPGSPFCDLDAAGDFTVSCEITR